MDSQKVNKVVRLDWIDSMRGIAALMVMILHLHLGLKALFPGYNVSFSTKIFDFFVFGAFDFGKIGVIWFFAVSGLVIPYSLLKYKDNNILRFLISRVFRLYPLYWVSIILALTIMGRTIMGQQISNTQIMVNITMLQRFIGFKDILELYWTLQIELVFYFFCIVLFYKKVLNNDKVIFYIIYTFIFLSFIQSLIRYITNIKLPVALTLGLAVMFLGIIWRRYIFKESPVNRNNIVKVVITFLIMLLPISFLAYNKDFGYQEVWYRYALSYITALTTFFTFSGVYRISNSIFSFLGKISYSVYLLHPIFGIYLLDRLSRTETGQVSGPYGLAVICMISVIITSAISYYLVEKPFINIGRKVTLMLINFSKPELRKLTKVKKL